MRLKFTAFLLALNVITFGLIIFLNNRPEESSDAHSDLSTMIGREVIEADRIELKGTGVDAPRVLERDGDSWVLTKPMRWSANYFAINRILNQLQFLEEEASFSIEEIEKTGQTLADYGLEDPWLDLTISHAEQSINLSIGKVTEIGNNIYILGPSREDIFVISEKVIMGLLVNLDDLRNREIFNIPVFEIDALALQIKTAASTGENQLKVRLARTNNGWSFEAPLSATADPTLVSNTINTLTAAKVVRFETVTSDPLLQGLENPFMRVTLHGNKRQQTLLIGNKGPDARDESATYFAQLEGNPTVFTVAAKPFDELLQAQEALRERNFMTFAPEELTAIHISESKKEIRLQKLETGEWQVIESSADSEIQPHRADPELMAQLINGLKTLRATDFAADTPTPTDLDRLGFTKPRRKVTLHSEDTSTTLLLAHPENDNEHLYARTDRADYIYQLPRRATLRMLPLNAAYYRNRTLDTLPEAAKITSLKLENIETSEVLFDYTFTGDTLPWASAPTSEGSEPTEAIPEQSASLALLNAIRQFIVKSYLIDGYKDAYPVDAEKTLPWKYRLSAAISLPGDEADRSDTRSYVFTERLSGTAQVGASKLHDSIFEIAQPTLDALYIFTDDMEIPPEAAGAPVPKPTPVVPLPDPTPTVVPQPEEDAQ